MAVPSARVTELLSNLTTDEKADVVTGAAMWTTRPVERAGVPQLTVTDGPNGARGSGLMGTGTATACIPAGSVLGATWDPELLERLGGLLGDECGAKGANVLLAPTINLHRNPLGGRNFECYSEDPVLTGQLAAGFVRGVQSRNVATTPKHFVGNDSEFERNTIDTQADERTLREVYLVPFEMAVKEGHAWGVMSAYNRLNGTFCSENEWLLQTVLRSDWDFDGFVVSDWFAARSTADSVKAGLSLEMPGEGNFYGRNKLNAALAGGELDEADLDRIVADVLTLAERTGAFDGFGGGPEKPLDRPEDRALTREAAAAGTVLLRNDGMLPLVASSLKSIAVIGPNSGIAKIMGGGSAGVATYQVATPLDAVTARLGDNAEVRYAEGCNIDRSIPALAAPLLEGDLTTEFFAGHEFAGDPLATVTRRTADFLFFGEPAPDVPADAFSLRATGTISASVDGPHELVLVQAGRTRVLIDGAVVLDATEGEHDRGDAFFGMGSVEIPATVQLTAGTPVPIVIEYDNQGAVLLTGVKVGLASTAERDLVGEAETLAGECDAVLVVVGTNDDWETEGRDRDQFELPGDQVELITRVAAANPRTVVVVNTGGVHKMDWIDLPGAVLNMGFSGQSMGEALVDILLGEAEPGGRMPTTVPARYEHSPAFLNYPGENSVVRYGEGLHIGHRWFDARHLEPAVAFGEGLSYATFEWGEPRLIGQVSDVSDLVAGIVVELDVTNTSDRDGSEVVQLYVAPPPSTLHRPVRELKAFAKVQVSAGATETVRLELPQRAFAYFDTGDVLYEGLVSMSPVPTAGADGRHTEPGWYVEPGSYDLVIAHSAVNHHTTLTLELTGDETRIAQ